MRRSLGVLLAGLLVFAAAEVEQAAAQMAQPSPVLESCPEPTNPIDLTTVEDVEQQLVGTWLRCGDAPFLLADAEPVGVELTADGRFFRVYQGEDGGLVRVDGLEQEGTWVVRGYGPPYQVDLTTVGLGTNMRAGLEFFDTPSQVRFGADLGPGGAAVLWTGDAPVPGPLPGAVDGPCARPRNPLVPTSVADVEQRLVGMWIRCGDVSGFGTPLEGQVGLEFTADRRFFRLYRGADGSPVRREGSAQQGTWGLIDVSSEGGSPAYQFNLKSRGSASITHLTLLQEPFHLRLIVHSELAPPASADYQLWDGEPLPVPEAPPAPEPPPTTVGPPDTQPPPAPPPSGVLPPTGSTPSVVVLALVCIAAGIVLRSSLRSTLP